MKKLAEVGKSITRSPSAEALVRCARLAWATVDEMQEALEGVPAASPAMALGIQQAASDAADDMVAAWKPDGVS